MEIRRLPDVPGAEHPEHDPLKEIAEQNVAAEVRDLGIGLDLDKHPKLRDRLAELGSHFADSVAMARIIGSIYEPLKERLGLHDADPDRLMTTAVLHDIGKSGPAGDKGPFHDAVRQLFIPPRKPFNPFEDGHAKTIADFMEVQGIRDPDSLADTLKEQGIDADKEPMLDFWRRHAEWTYEILRDEAGPDLDEDMITIAASHHILEGKNPANVETKDIPVEAHVLETLEMAGLMAAVDKYQAFRGRGRLGHDETIKRLRVMIDRNEVISDEVREKFGVVIDVLAESESELAEYFGRKE